MEQKIHSSRLVHTHSDVVSNIMLPHVTMARSIIVPFNCILLQFLL